MQWLHAQLFAAPPDAFKPFHDQHVTLCSARNQLCVLRNHRTRLPTSTFARFQNWSSIPLRLIVGYGFIAHGYAKLSHGPERFFLILKAIGVPAPHLMGWATILIELFGGAAVLAGAFVTLVSLPMAAVLLVAMFSVHLRYGFSSIKLIAVTAAGPQFGPPGYEVALLYLACLAALLMGGSGPLSIDSFRERR